MNCKTEYTSERSHGGFPVSLKKTIKITKINLWKMILIEINQSFFFVSEFKIQIFVKLLKMK